MQAAIDALPEELRQVLTLNLRHGLEPAEIAHALGLSASTVRTRLQRGRERLRERLPADVAACAGVAGLALRGLADVRAAVLERAAAAALPAAATVTLATALVTMKIAVPAVLVVVAAALWWSSGEPEPAREPVAASQPVRRAPAALSSAPVAEAPAPVSEPQREAVAAPATSTPAEPAAAADGPPQHHDPEHPHELHELAFLVVDRYDVPVVDAELRFTAVIGDGSAMAWGLEPDHLVTDARGRARMQIPDDQHGMAIEKITYVVHHPHFAPGRHSTQLDAGTVRVELEPGIFVIATGWIGSRDRVVADLEVRVDGNSKLTSDDWTPLRDGRLATSRLQAGPHALYLAHEDPGGRRFYSRLVDLELAAGEQRELHLELIPALRVEGMLDPSVPRPIVNGRAQLVLHNAPPTWDAPRLIDARTVEIVPDGSFVLEDVPPQYLDVVAVCDGWVSAVRAVESERARSGRPQIFVPDALGEPVVVAMQPAATLEVTALGRNGEPVPDVWLGLQPNVHWNSGFATILFGESVTAHTDPAGHARIENLLPGVQWLSVNHPDLVLDPEANVNLSDGQTVFRLALGSGETSRHELRLIPRPGGE